MARQLRSRHSDKLHLTERFQKTGPDIIKYTVTYEDPVFFTKPWTATLNFARQKDRLMEYVCNDNEKIASTWFQLRENP